MQIFNMLTETKGSGLTSGEVGLSTNDGGTLSQEDITAFLTQLELAYSQAAKRAGDGLAWSEIQVTEKGELLDPSGNLLPLSQLMSGQLLPFTQEPLPEESILTQIKMATSGEQVKLSPQIAAALQPQQSSEKNDLMASLQLPRAANGEVSVAPVMPMLPTVAVTGIEQLGASSHLPASFSILPPATQTAGSLLQLPTINQPVSGRGWGENLGERVQWMIRQEIQGAEVKLTPRGLGPIEIRVAVQNDQAHVSFVAHHAATREAIDAAIPRLREMFNDSNVNLVNVDVSDRNSAAFAGEGGGTAQDESDGKSGRDVMNLFDELSKDSSSEVRIVSNGLLDDYA